MLPLRFRNAFARAPHYDYGLLAFSAGSVVLATFAASLVWIATGWAEGSGCVIMTAVGASFFAALDDPAPQIKAFVIWMTVATAVSALYLFAILPQVHSFEMVVAVFALPFLYFGTLVSRPQFMLIAMLMAVNVASIVGIQETYGADFASFANNNLASIAGGFFGLAWTMATRPFGAALAARRLVAASWRDVAAIAKGSSRGADKRFAGRMLDRSGQLAPRLTAVLDGDAASTAALDELRLGLNLIELKRVRAGLDATNARLVDRLLEGTAALFEARARRGDRIPAPDELRAAIDAALDSLRLAVLSSARTDGLNALVGARRALFPQAPPPPDPQAVVPLPFAIAAE